MPESRKRSLKLVALAVQQHKIEVSTKKQQKNGQGKEIWWQKNALTMKTTTKPVMKNPQRFS